MTETTNPEIDVEGLMQHIKDEVERRKQCINAPPSLAEATQRLNALETALEQGWPTLSPCDLQPDFTPNPDRQYSLEELLRFHDHEFVANAYRAILLRPADPDGLLHFLDLVRRGKSKVSILGELRYSPEGQQHGVNIKGLRRSYLLRRLYDIPLVGRLIQIFAILANLPMLERNSRCFESYATQQVESLNQRIGESATATQTMAQQRWTALHIAIPALRRLLTELATGKADSLVLQDLGDALARETRDQLTRITDHLRQLEEQNLRQALETLHEQVRALQEIKADRENTDAQLRALSENKADLSQLSSLSSDLLRVDQAKVDQTAFSGLRDSVASLEQAKADRATTASTAAEIQRAHLRIQDLKRSLLDQQRRLGLLLEEARKRLPAPLDSAQLEAFAKEDDHLLDAMYATFEDQFRGTREDIKNRQRVYLPIMTDCNAGTPEAPVLDIGSGRGEWLELLRENRLVARGVDINHIFIKECLDIGLDVIESDALAYLNSQRDNIYGAITGLHIIEHLPIRTLIALFDEVLRVLQPGGVAVFETPNPSNILVGSCNFYIDPTHRNPLPSQLSLFLMEARGFVKIRIIELHPFDKSNLLADDDAKISQLINQHFFGPQDYAIVAYKT